MRKVNPKFKRGVSLMEVVVSMFIIVLVSVAATTLIISSINQEKRYSRNADIAITSENAIECFRYANDFESYLDLLQKVDQDFTGENNRITLFRDDYFFVIETDYTQTTKSVNVSAYENLTLLKQFSYTI